MPNDHYVNRVTLGNCIQHLDRLDDNSISLLLSDIPYGINLDEWDVLHSNRNSALLGVSPAQAGKSGFKRRGKPINGWSHADRQGGREYQEWCGQWASQVYPKMQSGASVLVFGARRTIHRAINALEDSGFLLKDMLAWKKPAAHHRAQKLSGILEKRGMHAAAEQWDGWRLGNLAPIWEPIAWLVKPYDISGTLTDNVLQNGLGAMHTSICTEYHSDATTMLDFKFGPDERRVHEAQKPLALMEYLIALTTCEGHIVLDPFMGSGTTAVAAIRLHRDFIGFEKLEVHHTQAQARINAAVG